MKKLFQRAALWLLLSNVVFQIPSVRGQGTSAFTLQGRLNSGTNAANGSYDMSFTLYDANVSGNQIAGPITNSAVAVSNGLFTVTLNFGAGVFTGTNYWVQMAVSPAGANTFAALVPRQQLTPAPYALSLVAPQATALNPAGAVIAFAGPTNHLPNGYLFCDGRAVSRTTYANLFAAIGTAWGYGDNSTTFNLPNMQGVFLRGVDNGVGNDPDTASRAGPAAGANGGDAVGSYQADAFQNHAHQDISDGGSAGGNNANVRGYATDNADRLLVGPVSTTRDAGGGLPRVSSETRPKNVYVNYIIKY